MAPEEKRHDYPEPTRRGMQARVILTAAAVVAIALMMLEYYVFFRSDIGPEQPIPFSHRFHVSDRGLSCILCHPGVINSANADIPTLETCMLCHHTVIYYHPQIERLRQLYSTGRPVAWARITQIPNFVFFNHSVHWRAGFDCAVCHGEIAQMDRIVLQQKIKMGFCRNCHVKESFSTDCLICHR